MSGTVERGPSRAIVSAVNVYLHGVIGDHKLNLPTLCCYSLVLLAYLSENSDSVMCPIL